jgi:hypothetical protein
MKTISIESYQQVLPEPDTVESLPLEHPPAKYA